MVKPKKENQYKGEPRSLNLELYVASHDEGKPLTEEERTKYLWLLQERIGDYRTAMRCAATILAHAESAGVKKDIDSKPVYKFPTKEQVAKAILFMTGEKPPKGESVSAYLSTLIKRSWLKDWYTQHADQISEFVISTWSAKDPEFDNFKRNFLFLKSMRRVPMFMNARMFFRAWTDKTLLPLSGNKVLLRIKPGEEIPMKVKCADGYILTLFEKIREGQLTAGGMKLGFDWPKGKAPRIRLSVSYFVPKSESKQKKGRVMEVGLDAEPNREWVCRIKHPAKKVDIVRNRRLRIQAALNQIARLDKQKDWREEDRKACGGKYQGGHRKAHVAATERLNRITRAKDGTKTSWNGHWSEAIVRTAINYQVEKVEFFQPEDMYGREWSFSDLVFRLTYKLSQRGIGIEVIKEKKAKDSVA